MGVYTFLESRQAPWTPSEVIWRFMTFRKVVCKLIVVHDLTTWGFNNQHHWLVLDFLHILLLPKLSKSILYQWYLCVYQFLKWALKSYIADGKKILLIEAKLHINVTSGGRDLADCGWDLAEYVDET